MKKYAMFIGRWQPFHKGHERLIRTVLEEGEPVLIALRDTEEDDENPYSIEQRQQMIAEVFADEMKMGMVRIMVIPDIASVNYGRDVGYEIRKIRLDADTEAISGTKIRNSGGL